MSTKIVKQAQVMVWMLLMMGLCITSARAATFTTTWDGTGDGLNYCDPDNWDLRIVPCNHPGLTFEAIIPASKTVQYSGDGGCGNLCEVDDFTLSDNSTLKPVYDELWSVDIQGAGGPEGSQLDPPALKDGKESKYGYGYIWNAFDVPGHDLPAAVNPSMDLIVCHGEATTVNFAVNGNVGGYSNDGTDDLRQDYLFVNGGNSDPNVTWSVTGLLPGAKYDFYPYSSATNNISITVDTDGDGSMDNNTAKTVGSNGLLFSGITADENGTIIGRTAPGTSAEGHWAGFQLRQWCSEHSRWPGKLTVMNSADIWGTIDADNADFDALIDPCFCGHKARVFATQGAEVHIAAPYFSSKGWWQSWDPGWQSGDQVGTWYPDIMKVEGEGTLLDLSGLESIDAGFSSSGNDHTYQRITASGGGTIDLSGVQTITGPKQGRDRLEFIVDSSDSMIRFNNLLSIDTTYHYYPEQVLFNLSEATLEFPVLASIDQVDYYLSSGSEITTPSLTSIEDTEFKISGGSKFVGSTASGTYSVLGIWQSWDPGWQSGDQVGTWYPDIMKVEGEGTLLDLSGLESIDAGFSSSGNDHTYQRITASGGGTIDLSGVQTITGPKQGRDRLEFIVDSSDSMIRFNNLLSIDTTYHYYPEQVLFNLSEATLEFPVLASIDQVDYYLSSGSEITTPSLTSIEDTEFKISGGSKFVGSTASGTYSVLGIWQSWDPGWQSGDQVGTWTLI